MSSSVSIDPGSPLTGSSVQTPLRVAVICDFLEERWPSMDYYGDTLYATMSSVAAPGTQITQIRPPMPRLFERIPLLPGRIRGNADRVFGRHIYYSQFLSRLKERFDLFHIVDHSYAHLALALPAGRTIITCHDLDAFWSILEPSREVRPSWFRALAARTKRGLLAAAHVICDSAAVQDQLVEYRLCAPNGSTVIPIGVHPSCSAEADPMADSEADRLLMLNADDVAILHVGSTIPRKRIDVLLRVFAAVHRRVPNARLVRAGGAFTKEQEQLANDLGIRSHIRVLPFLSREVLAAVYRRAAVTLQPSEAEGFGLPVVEAAACGSPVIASDLAVLREVGGPVTEYCPVGDIDAWAKAVLAMLEEERQSRHLAQIRRQRCIEYSTCFRWEQTANRTLQIYNEVSKGMRS